jgi:hypothetical protein
MLGSICMCFADRGMIPINPDVQLFEPNQRAMIAWNGLEEILLLSTDVRASESTMVLEVLPVPTEPDVKKGDLETFRRATTLINRSLVLTSKKNGGRSTEGGIPTPGGEVTFHKKIGAHDISVTHLLNADKFVDWVKEYLKTLDIEEVLITDKMQSLIGAYIEDGFEWYVFDVITVGVETVTNEPIQYRFKTKKLFYPLRITQTAQGNTSIELLILTPRLLQRFPGLPLKQVHLKHEPITITKYDVEYLDKDMHELLAEESELKLRIWEIEGDLELFDKDLIAY